MSETNTTENTKASGENSGQPRKGGRNRTSGASVLASGTPMVWLTGGAMTICLVMIVSLLLFVFYEGFLTFWPEPVIQVHTVQGNDFMGEVTRRDRFKPGPDVLEEIPKSLAAKNLDKKGWAKRRLVRTGNFEITNEHFTWVSDFEIEEGKETRPEWVMVFERMAWGRFYGIPQAFLIDGKAEATEPEKIWDLYNQWHPIVRDKWQEARELEKDDIGAINYDLERERLALREIELKFSNDSPEWKNASAEFKKFEAVQQNAFAEFQKEIRKIDKENDRYQIRVTTADGMEKDINLDDIDLSCEPYRFFWKTRGIPGPMDGVLF